MTAQFSDHFRHRGTDHSVIGMPDPSLFDSAIFGLDPVGTCTACHCGYVATFAVADGRLVVDALDVNLYEPDDGRDPARFKPRLGAPVNGASPAGPPGRHAGLLNNRYRGLANPLAYTGDLLIGDGLIPELHNHMRSAAWKFRTVVELAFEDGRLRRETDRSAEAAEARARALFDRPRGDLGRRVERRRARPYRPT